MAGNFTQLQWVPPPIGTWNLTADCSSYARFVSTILRRSGGMKVDMCGFDVDALHEYVASSIPSTYQNSDQNFTRTRTAIWYLSACERPTNSTQSLQCYGDHSCLTSLDFHNNVSSMIHQSQSGQGACLAELLSSLNIKGNADMAGIGVMVSFCIEAFLIIAFLTSYTAARLRRNRVPLSRGEKISDAFRAVLPTFYWSSVLLSLGITVASLKASVEASRGGKDAQLESWREGESVYSPYDTHLAAMASLFSALPPFMAGILLQQPSRRRRLLNAMILSILEILPMPLIIMWSREGSLWGGATGADLVTDLLFNDMIVLTIYALTAFSLLGSTMFIGWIVMLCRCKRYGLVAKVPQRRSTCIEVSTGLVQVVLLAMMISALGLFFFIRAKIIGSGDDSQLEWSFGQVLALTTWIPVVVDFVYTLCVGMKKGLEGHLPGDYSVVQQQGNQENKESQLEKGQQSQERGVQEERHD